MRGKGMSKHTINPIDMKRIALFALLAIAMLSACKKDDTLSTDDDKKPNTGIPKQGLELLTTDADTCYIIMAKADDTTIVRSSQGIDFFEFAAQPRTYGDGSRSIQYSVSVDGFTSASFRAFQFSFGRHLTATEKVECNDVEQVIKPGKYNVGSGSGNKMFISVLDERGYSEWSEISSNNTPVEIISVTKIEMAKDCAKYRVRGRFSAFELDAQGCPIPWEVFTGGVFQVDYYVKQ